MSCTLRPGTQFRTTVQVPLHALTPCLVMGPNHLDGWPNQTAQDSGICCVSTHSGTADRGTSTGGSVLCRVDGWTGGRVSVCMEGTRHRLGCWGLGRGKRGKDGMPRVLWFMMRLLSGCGHYFRLNLCEECRPSVADLGLDIQCRNTRLWYKG